VLDRSIVACTGIVAPLALGKSAMITLQLSPN
jgi:hypothetical protein